VEETGRVFSRVLKTRLKKKIGTHKEWPNTVEVKMRTVGRAYVYSGTVVGGTCTVACTVALPVAHRCRVQIDRA
jgi:hypothetical protein